MKRKTNAELLAEIETLKSLNNGSIGIQIGAQRDAIEAADVVIMKILEARVDEKTKRFALKRLGNICSVDGAVVHGCSVNMAAGND